MKNAYALIGRERPRIATGWALRTFASGSTFRLFKSGEKPRINKFLEREIGNGRGLASLDRLVYDEKIVNLCRRFRTRFKCNNKMKSRRPSFGHAAKVINLYVKALLLLPSYIAGYNRARLERNAHIILDGVVLKHMWGSRKGEGHFRNEISERMHRKPSLGKLDEAEYKLLQDILRTAAKPTKTPPIAYDFLWAIRDE